MHIYTVQQTLDFVEVELSALALVLALTTRAPGAGGPGRLSVGGAILDVAWLHSFEDRCMTSDQVHSLHTYFTSYSACTRDAGAAAEKRRPGGGGEGWDVGMYVCISTYNGGTYMYSLQGT